MSAPAQDLRMPLAAGHRRLFRLANAAPFLVTDALAILASSAAVVLVRYALGGQFTLYFYLNLAFLTLLFLVVYALLGLYPGTGLHPVTELRKVFHGTTVSFLIVATATFFMRDAEAYSRAVLIGAWACSLFGVAAGRMALRDVLAGQKWWGERVVVIGSHTSAAQVHEALCRNAGLGLRPEGLITVGPADPDARVLGDVTRAELIGRARNIRYAIVALPERPAHEVAELTRRYAAGFHRILVISDLFNVASLEVTTIDVGGYLGVEFRHRLLFRTPRLIKRAMDVAASAALVLALAPVVAAAAALIRLTSRGPVFYGQTRIGLGGRRFKAWKLRTMRHDAAAHLERCLAADPELHAEWSRERKLKHDPRVTRLGRFLRKSSLDELPQVWNVLRGEMSLIGPRPIVDEEVAKYGPGIELYYSVRPGISGLWQVSGRNNTTYAERVRLDDYYVRNWSVWLDLHILARTVRVVLTREGAY